MKFVVIFVVAVAAVSALPRQRPVAKFHKSHAPFPKGRIAGGEDASIEDYPYQASVLWLGYHICGGSIISENYVVTAAHCTDLEVAEDLAVRVGSSIMEQGGTVIQVFQIHQNPDFNVDLQYDISVLHLAEPITFGAGVQPINLPTTPVAAGTEAVVSGWGTLSSSASSLSEQLQVVTVNVIDFPECQDDYSSWWYNVLDTMLCAGVPEGGKDACQGDTGGPLVVDNTLYGIVSWGNECALSDYPGVYADVSSLLDFITEVTGL